MIIEGLAIGSLIFGEAVLGFFAADAIGRTLLGEPEDETLTTGEIEYEGRRWRTRIEMMRDGTPQSTGLWKNEKTGRMSRISKAERDVIVTGDRLRDAIINQGFDAEDTRVYSAAAAHHARELRKQIENSLFRDAEEVQEG